MYTAWLIDPATWPQMECFFDNKSTDKDLAIIDPELELEVSAAGTFEFTLPPNHLYYDQFVKMVSLVAVARNNEIIWIGRVIEEEVSFYKEKKLLCEGAFAFLNDSLQLYAKTRYTDLNQLFRYIISVHNTQVESYKRFSVGSVTVSPETIEMDAEQVTNYETTMEILKSLQEKFGGVFLLRYTSNLELIIDWLKEPISVCAQEIEFGKNLLDYSHNYKIEDLCTAVVPLGPVIGTEEDGNPNERLTCSDANEGIPFVLSEEAIQNYGWIAKTLDLDKVNDPEVLKLLGEYYLKNQQFDNMEINVKVFDLGMLSKRPQLESK